jgi:serine/threonine-protein kinase
MDPKRLLDELAALQEIRSKHVVQIYDVIRDAKGAVKAIIEEYLPGKDLLAAPPVSTAADLIKLIYPIAEGIADIHAHDRIHRDIKPNNMKLDAEGCLKIFDFGLSRLESDGKTASIAITPGYAAPELFVAGRSGKVEFTQSVDVFAFGATALFLATKKLPGDLVKAPPRLPAAGADFGAIPQGLPSDVVSLLNRCFEAKPHDRPEMSEIRDTLASHLLKDQHRALLVFQGKPYHLDASNRVVDLSAPTLGTLRITYDGHRFVVSNVSGDVSINNMTISNGHVISGSCVIILGAPAKGAGRIFITLDVAHPEVTL